MMTDSNLLPAAWQVPPAFHQRLGTHAGRQRIMQSDGHLLVVLHEPPTGDSDDRIGRCYWRNPDGQWMPMALRHGEHAMDELLDKYDKAIDRLDDQEEAANSADDYFEILRHLHPLVRASNNLHTTLQKARDAVRDDRKLILLRDTAYANARRAELLHADTRHALDYHIAQRAEEQADAGQRMAAASHRLNLLVAFFFPLATLAGIFGMNIPIGIEAASDRMGWVLTAFILLAGLAMGAVLTAFVTLPPSRKRRRRKPLRRVAPDPTPSLRAERHRPERRHPERKHRARPATPEFTPAETIPPETTPEMPLRGRALVDDLQLSVKPEEPRQSS